MSTSPLVERLARQAFEFFWNETSPVTGLTKDRASNRGPADRYTVASVAATGYALAALPIGVTRGWVKRGEAQRRAAATLTFLSEPRRSVRGFFYHFLDQNTGERVWSCELSSIDSCLLFLGMLAAGRFFGGAVAEQADGLVASADWEWMQNGALAPSMGWKPESGFIEARWSGYTEACYLYLLALGLPTFPLPQASWDALTFPEVMVEGHRVFGGPTPAFFAQMTPGYIDLRGRKDRQSRDWWRNFENAHRANAAFCARNESRFTTYCDGIWGITACDQPPPVGYGAQSPRDGDHDGTIAPTAAWAGVLFVPELAEKALAAIERRFGGRVSGRYGFSNAFNADKDWFDPDVIGIDLGMALLATENQRSGLLWKLLAGHPYLRKGLTTAGFLAEKRPRHSGGELTP